MSGGSWSYGYDHIDEMALRLIESKEPLRRALGRHMQKVSRAMHDIEWVDSCDNSPGDEVAAIEDVLGDNAKALTLAEVVRSARVIMEQLKDLTESKP